MRFVIQRVLKAHVEVQGQVVGKIGPGLVVLFGLNDCDSYDNLEFAANKLLNMRLFDDDKGVRWKEGVKTKKYEILLVSQFTLYSAFKGNKPEFRQAMSPGQAKKMYETFLSLLKKKYTDQNIQAGCFGEMMQVSLVNDGPVTINWEYPEKSEKQKSSNIDVLPENKGEQNNRICYEQPGEK